MATPKKKKVKRGPRKTKRQRRIAQTPEAAGLFQRDQPPAGTGTLLDGIEWALKRVRKLQERPGYYPALTAALNDACGRVVSMLGSSDETVRGKALDVVVKMEGFRVRQEEAQLTHSKGVLDGLALVQLGRIQASVHQEGGPESDAPKVLEDVLAKARGVAGEP